MRLGIMSAMAEENLLLASKLKNTKTTTAAHRSYIEGEYLGHQVVIAFSRWGKIASAITATHMIGQHQVEMILFTGVAGASSENLQVGDIVVADHLIQHDMDARPIYPRFEIPLINKSSFAVEEPLLKKTLHAADRFLGNYTQYLRPEDIQTFALHAPKLHQGKIASGDKFFSSSADLKALRQALPDVLCVEMEGASVAQVCHEHQVPFSIIRTISDNGDENSHRDFQRFVTAVASPYSLGILEHLLPLL